MEILCVSPRDTAQVVIVQIGKKKRWKCINSPHSFLYGSTATVITRHEVGNSDDGSDDHDGGKAKYMR